MDNALNVITNKVHSYAETPRRRNITVCNNKVAQELIANAYSFFKNKWSELGPPIDVTAACLGIKRVSVMQYKGGTTDIQSIRRKRPKLSTTYLDLNRKKEIRRVIYQMLKEKKHINLDTLNQELRIKYLHNHSGTSLAKLLKHMRFSYKKDNNRRALIEISYVVSQRRTFLEKYMQNLNCASPKNIVVLDETWVYANGSVRKSWQDQDIRSIKRSSGDGARHIAINAGNSEGFIPHVGKMFKSNTDSKYYHKAMTSQLFEEWIGDLCSALDKPSIIILDNASYHSRLKEKRPTSAWKKLELQQWLNDNNLIYESSDKKDTLLQICKNNYKDKRYAVDELIENVGHQVLRLPPYHCIFNAIEMVWSQAKRSYDKEVLKPSVDPITAWTNALKTITCKQWGHYFQHVHNVISEYWEREKMLMTT